MADGKVGAPEGNKNATKEKRIVSDILRRVVTQNPDKIRQACIKLLDAAAEGKLPEFRELFDRLEGKPAQSVEMKVTDLTHEEALDLLDVGTDEPERRTTH